MKTEFEINYGGSPNADFILDQKKRWFYTTTIQKLCNKLTELHYSYVLGKWVTVLRRRNCYTVYVPEKKVVVFLHFGNFSLSDNKPYQNRMPENASYKALHIYDTEIDYIERLIAEKLSINSPRDALNKWFGVR